MDNSTDYYYYDNYTDYSEISQEDLEKLTEIIDALKELEQITTTIQPETPPQTFSNIILLTFYIIYFSTSVLLVFKLAWEIIRKTPRKFVYLQFLILTIAYSFGLGLILFGEYIGGFYMWDINTGLMVIIHITNMNDKIANFISFLNGSQTYRLLLCFLHILHEILAKKYWIFGFLAFILQLTVCWIFEPGYMVYIRTG
ncbi:unnamed protein product [Caenorhabditis angaria]|uniref:Uncharacterized protein n=1 Tax=Caenorhabditis angaria TaxID=860376 RepID=A0A9P1IRD6_9PELO|nr:unnamed protein product [Caenorhabditis angaria]